MGKRRFTYLTVDEVERFFQAIPKSNTRDRLLFDLIYRHALRRQEAVNLLTEDVQGGRIWIERVKDGVSGEYPLHPFTQKLLNDYLKNGKNPDNPFLLNSRQSGDVRPIGTSTIFFLFRKYAEKANIPQRKQHPHILRHSIATHLRSSGWDLSDVQDWLGHKNITSTTIYSKVTHEKREENYEMALKSDKIAINQI